MSKPCSRKVNKARYDNPGKPMKQTNFTVKNRKPSRNAIYYSKEKFQI